MTPGSGYFFLATAFLLLSPIPGAAQGTREDYQRAEQFLPGNLRHRIYVADVAPHWIATARLCDSRRAGSAARSMKPSKESLL